MDLVATDGQKAALRTIDALDGDEDAVVGVVAGYAGTGKTTMIKLIEKEFGEPLVITPTGKAALRVSEASGINATTIHRWLCKVENDRKTGEPRFLERDTNEVKVPENNIVVCDEASMVSPQGTASLDHLLVTCNAIGAKLVLVGDTFQLPPISKEGAFSALNHPTPHRSSLNEVLRQALDSPVIRASMDIRKSEIGMVDAYEHLEFASNSNVLNVAADILGRGGAVICFTNAARFRLNNEIRKMFGHTGGIDEGEPLLVLKNNYNLDRFNGEIITFDGWEAEPRLKKMMRDPYTEKECALSFGVAKVCDRLVMLCEQEIEGKVDGMSENGLAVLAKQYFKQHFSRDFNTLLPYLNASYGYTLTCHKSQGSEWNEVLVYKESVINKVYSSYEFRRWMYTAITRAKKRAVVHHAQ